jgi:SNF2 family DNA or RNA helicase
VKALEAVMPEDIPHTAISVQMGAPWIEPSDISRFVAEMFNDSASSIKVFYDRGTGAYQVEMEPSARARRSQETTTTWGTPQRPFQELLDLALQGRAATVTKEVPAPTVADPYATRTVIDPEKTQAANTKLDAIKQRFREWVWEDDARRERLTRRYNEMFNSLRVAEYDSSFMGAQVPGMSPDWKLRPHQMAAVLRGITDRRGLMAHEVGLGKTLAMIATASELKRLGIAAKPAIAVPKKVLPGFARTARDAFPLMKLHVIDSRDAEKRQRTMSEIATGDFDLVLMTHDNLNMLRMRPEFEAGILRKELDEVNAVYDILRSEQRQAGGRGTKADAKILATIKKRRENLAAKIKDALNTKLKDDAITFEASGIDFMFVDEFHEYKSLPIVTALGQVKGVPTGDSQRAINMLMRARYLQELQKGGGLIAATGTPVSNSLVEAYIMAKFIQPEVLEDAGIDAFDAWARNFAEVVSALEFDATGRWKPTSRMSKFKNLPELQTMSRVTLDVKTAKETGILQKRPRRKDLVISISLDDTQKLFMRNLRERADRLKGGKVDPSVDNYLVVSNDGRLMSADIRMVLPGMENRPSAKIQALVENVTRIHKEKPGTTQMIFCDIGVQPNAWGFHLYGEIMDRLAGVGIPKDRIIDFSKLDSDVKVEKAVERLRSGDAIIAIGHRKNMGTGVNAQDKMAAVHQFDTTWKPAMIEQSEARGWRQGNENPEIEILTYVVEGSFDSTMWATVARKQQAIASFMRGAVTARELTEEDGEVLSYEQIAAAASGDQDYLRKAELEQRVFKLAMMKQAHDADVTNRRQAIPRIEGSIAAKQRAAERYDDLAEWAKGVRERAVEYVSAEGKLYTDRAEAAKALTLDIAVAQKRNKDAKIADQERIYIGEYKGVRVRVETFGEVRGVIPAYGRNSVPDIFSINPNFENYAGTLQSFDQSLASIAANNDAKRLREVEIPSLDQDLANLRRIGETPFQDEQELTTAKAQLDRVSKRLAAKEQEAENAGEPLVAESGLDVRMTGQLGRRLRRGLREKELKPSDIPALLERELARIKTETNIAKAEWAEYVRQKTEEQIDLYGLEGVALGEMAKSASRAQQAYGDLYAEQQEQVESGVLKERSNDWQPKPVSHSSSFADIADNIRFRTSKSPARANLIYGNEQAHFWVDRADRRLYNDPSAFNGLNLSPAEARQLAIEIRSEKRWWEKDKRRLITWLRPSERAMYGRADTQIDALAKTFEDLADKHERVIYIRSDRTFRGMRNSIYHELSHNAERRFRGNLANWFRRAPHADRIAAELDRLGYRESDYVGEAIAHLLGGQRWKLKLSFEEAVEFLDDYFANVSFSRGREAIITFQELHTAPEMRQTLREAKEKYGPRTGIQGGAGELPPALPGDEGTGGGRSLRDSEPGEGSLAGGRQGRLGGVSPETGGESTERRRGAEGLTGELPLTGEDGAYDIAFSPTQINSAISNRGTLDRRDRSIPASVQRGGLSHIFYSQASRIIEQKAPSKASGAQILAILKNPQNAVKKEELDWLDIEAWLADRKTVTKEEVLGFIQENQAEISEVIRGGGLSGDVIAKMRSQLDWLRLELERLEYERVVAELKYERQEYEHREMLQEAQSRLTDALGWDEGEAAAFEESMAAYGIGSYEGELEGKNALRGAINDLGNQIEKARANIHAMERALRGDVEWEVEPEVEMWIPESAIKDFEERNGPMEVGCSRQENSADGRYTIIWMANMSGDGLAYLFDNFGDGFDVFDSTAEARASAQREQPVMVRNPTRHEDLTIPGGKNYRELILTMPGQIKPYRPDEDHFTEEGGGTAVAWIRFNDRLGEDGKRILFIEEIQSKRHQDARAHGYQGELPPGWKVIGESGLGDGRWYTVVDSEGGVRAQSLNRQGAIERATAGGVPAAPFRTSWPDLAWKRALRWAVENDYDRVAWTTGEMQAKRYGLSKRIDKLKVLEGRYTEVPGIEGYEVTGWKNGRELLNQRIARDRLPDLIGKEMGETVVAQIEVNKQRPVPTYAAVFEGLDLTVGGEGMNYFYDRMLPSFVNRYVKKWGARVEQEAIPLGSYGFDVRQSGSGLWNVFDYASDIVHRATTEEEAKAWVKRQGRAEETVHSVTITDKMRESVMLGQPLYERQRETAGREIPESSPSLSEREGEGQGNTHSFSSYQGAIFSDNPAVAGSYGSRELESPTFDASTPRVAFIEDALAAGASVDHISIQYHGSDWTVVSFGNAEGTYLVKGEDVYVTQASVQEAQAAIEADPDALPGINDLKFAGDIEIRVSEIRSTENQVEPRGRVVEHSLSV